MKTKIIFAAILVLLLVIVLVLVLRTVTYKFGKVEKNVSDKELVNTTPSEQAIRRFVGGIRIRQSAMKFMKKQISSRSMNL